MGSLRAASTCCVLALAMALGLSACGGGADLLPGKTADQINQNLDQVRAFVAEGDCAGAEAAVAEVSEEVDGLGGVDKKLKAALRQGTDRLGEVVASCGEEALEEAYRRFGLGPFLVKKIERNDSPLCRAERRTCVGAASGGA